MKKETIKESGLKKTKKTKGGDSLILGRRKVKNPYFYGIIAVRGTSIKKPKNLQR